MSAKHFAIRPRTRMRRRRFARSLGGAANLALGEQLHQGLFIEQSRDDWIGVGRADTDSDAFTKQAKFFLFAGKLKIGRDDLLDQRLPQGTKIDALGQCLSVPRLDG